MEKTERKDENFEQSHNAEKRGKCLTSILLLNIKNIEGGPFEGIKMFWKKISKSRKNGRVAVPKKIKERKYLLWNGFALHVKDIRCVRNQVLSSYGKKVHSLQKVDRSR